MEGQKSSWFGGLFSGGKKRGSSERVPGDVREQDDDFDDFWKTHGARFREEDKGQVQMVYRAYHNDPAVVFEDEMAAEMLTMVKALLGGPESPPPAAAALEVPPEEEKRKAA